METNGIHTHYELYKLIYFLPYKHFVIMAPILDGHEDVHEVYEYVFARVVYTHAHPGNTTAQSNKVQCRYRAPS